MSTTKTTAALLGIGGLLYGAGGQTHPIAEGDTLPAALASMTRQSTWTLSHLLFLAGLSVAAIGLLHAFRHRDFGVRINHWVALAVVGFSLAAIELVPHLLTSSQQANLEAGNITGIALVHLVLQAITGPLLATSAAALAVMVARTARTTPAWLLAGIAVVGCIAFGLAGPLVATTGIQDFAIGFIGQAGIAIWLVGTAIRLSRTPVAATASSENRVPVGV